MAGSGPTSLANAINFALAILEPFRDSSVYDDYQAVDGWTDDQFQTALEVLSAAAVEADPARPDFVVEGTE